ncbi:MAG TPA: hypothetical protein VGD27_01960 [Longimicrobiales bacterium]
MKAALLALALLGTVSPSLLAQMPAPTEEHAQLRAGGLASSVSASALPVDTATVTAVAPLHSVTVRIRQDRTSLQGATRGIAVGLLIGGGVGIIAGLKAGAADCGKPSGMGCVVHDAVNAIAPIFGGIVGAGAGALIGGLIGSVRPGEHWVRITVPM